jgi:acyl-CoA synthetase (AMP-forming)/AMP-acid ligase II
MALSYMTRIGAALLGGQGGIVRGAVDVAEAAAYGVPHPRLGEDVAAAVVRPGSKVTGPDLREFLREQLARCRPDSLNKDALLVLYCQR